MCLILEEGWESHSWRLILGRGVLTPGTASPAQRRLPRAGRLGHLHLFCSPATKFPRFRRLVHGCQRARLHSQLPALPSSMAPAYDVTGATLGRPQLTSRLQVPACRSLLPGFGARRLSIVPLQARVSLPLSDNEKDGLRCTRPLALLCSFTHCRR